MNGDERHYLVLAKPHPLIVGVNDRTSNVSLHDRWTSQVFPNPASDHITVTCTEVIRDITIFDVSGRVQFNSRFVGTESIHLDLTRLPAGVYPTMVTTSLGSQWHMMMKR